MQPPLPVRWLLTLAEWIGKDAKGLRRLLLWIVGFVLIVPLVLLVVGMVFDSRLLVGLAAILWGVAFLLLSVVASPLAVPLAAALEAGVPGVESIVGGVRQALIVGFTLAIGLAILPVRENPANLVILLLCIAVLMLTDAVSHKLINAFVFLVFVALVVSFVFPQRMRVLSEGLETADWLGVEPTRVAISCDHILAGEYRAFLPNDEPALWFYRGADGLEWFDRAGPHPRYGEDLSAVTPEVVRAEEARCRDEQARMDRRRDSVAARAGEEAREREAVAHADAARHAERERIARAESARIERIERERLARAEAARVERIEREFAQFANNVPRSAEWTAQDRWRRVLDGKKVLIRYEGARVEDAGRLASRLTQLGSEWTAELLLNSGRVLGSDDVTYPPRDLEAAQAIQSVVVDLTRVRISSSPAVRSISVSLY